METYVTVLEYTEYGGMFSSPRVQEIKYVGQSLDAALDARIAHKYGQDATDTIQTWFDGKLIDSQKVEKRILEK